MNNKTPPPEVEQILNMIVKMKSSIAGILIPLVRIYGATSAYYTVEPDEEAVVIRLGKHLENTQAGLHFKIPFGVDEVIKVKTKIVHQAEFGFRKYE